jgi:hypothetical protein
MATYPDHGFADDLSLATGSSTNMIIQLQATTSHDQVIHGHGGRHAAK